MLILATQVVISTTVFLTCNATMLQSKLKENVTSSPLLGHLQLQMLFQDLTKLSSPLKIWLVWFLACRSILSVKSSFCQRMPQNCEASFYIDVTGFPHATALRQTIVIFTRRTTFDSAAATAGMLCLELSSQPSDYSYFKSDLMSTWAGPQHWRLHSKLSKGIKEVLSSGGAINCGCICFGYAF